jgi:hypothetical protein
MIDAAAMERLLGLPGSVAQTARQSSISYWQRRDVGFDYIFFLPDTALLCPNVGAMTLPARPAH